MLPPNLANRGSRGPGHGVPGTSTPSGASGNRKKDSVKEALFTPVLLSDRTSSSNANPGKESASTLEAAVNSLYGPAPSKSPFGPQKCGGSYQSPVKTPGKSSIRSSPTKTPFSPFLERVLANSVGNGNAAGSAVQSSEKKRESSLRDSTLLQTMSRDELPPSHPSHTATHSHSHSYSTSSAGKARGREGRGQSRKRAASPTQMRALRQQLDALKRENTRLRRKLGGQREVREKVEGEARKLRCEKDRREQALSALKKAVGENERDRLQECWGGGQTGNKKEVAAETMHTEKSGPNDSTTIESEGHGSHSGTPGTLGHYITEQGSSSSSDSSEPRKSEPQHVLFAKIVPRSLDIAGLSQSFKPPQDEESIKKREVEKRDARTLFDSLVKHMQNEWKKSVESQRAERILREKRVAEFRSDFAGKGGARKDHEEQIPEPKLLEFLAESLEGEGSQGDSQKSSTTTSLLAVVLEHFAEKYFSSYSARKNCLQDVLAYQRKVNEYEDKMVKKKIFLILRREAFVSKFNRQQVRCQEVVHSLEVRSSSHQALSIMTDFFLTQIQWLEETMIHKDSEDLRILNRLKDTINATQEARNRNSNSNTNKNSTHDRLTGKSVRSQKNGGIGGTQTNRNTGGKAVAAAAADEEDGAGAHRHDDAEEDVDAGETGGKDAHRHGDDSLTQSGGKMYSDSSSSFEGFGSSSSSGSEEGEPGSSPRNSNSSKKDKKSRSPKSPGSPTSPAAASAEAPGALAVGKTVSEASGKGKKKSKKKSKKKTKRKNGKRGGKRADSAGNEVSDDGTDSGQGKRKKKKRSAGDLDGENGGETGANTQASGVNGKNVGEKGQSGGGSGNGGGLGAGVGSGERKMSLIIERCLALLKDKKQKKILRMKQIQIGCVNMERDMRHIELLKKDRESTSVKEKGKSVALPNGDSIAAKAGRDSKNAGEFGDSRGEKAKRPSGYGAVGTSFGSALRFGFGSEAVDVECQTSKVGFSLAKNIFQSDRFELGVSFTVGEKPQQMVAQDIGKNYGRRRYWYPTTIIEQSSLQIQHTNPAVEQGLY